MDYRFERKRSDFWIIVHEREQQDYNISVNEKYTGIISHFCPDIVACSPTKWKQSKTREGMCNLWIPENRYNPEAMDKFLKWGEEAVNNVLWIGLNKNIRGHFDRELDYCIASDFNIVYGEDRTEAGEAEYRLKYHSAELTDDEWNKYRYVIRNRMSACCKYIPVDNGENWCVSPMPATESGKEKFAWKMAEKISGQLELPFVEPVLRVSKPEMKQLSAAERIDVWNKIYEDNGVSLEGKPLGENVIVVDDLYQSGTTMWEYARYLKSLGVKCVFGIVCVKSLRDSDNI